MAFSTDFTRKVAFFFYRFNAKNWRFLVCNLMTNRAVTAINSPTSILSPPAPCPQPQIILLGTESRVTISKQCKSSLFHLSCLFRFSGPSCPSCLLKFYQNYEICSKFLVIHPQTETPVTDCTDLCKRDGGNLLRC